MIYRRLVSGLVLLSLAVAVAGCRTGSGNEYVRMATPLPPAFLAGPAGVLLTNTTGFSSQVEVTGELVAGNGAPVRGQLVGAGAKLMFAPVRDKAAEKRTHAGNFLFIWDVAQASGYVLSEALQAYAPISSDVHATNVVEQAATQTASGLSQLAIIEMNNGTAEAFQVVPAPELRGFPLRIRSISNAVPLTVSFSKIRSEKVAADLFTPPEGFTKYSSPEAMVDELAARQRNLRRRSTGDYNDINTLMQQQQTRP